MLDPRNTLPRWADLPHGLGGYNFYGCRCGKCRKAEAREVEAATEQGRRPFTIPRCADCSAPLCDPAGNPRWRIANGIKLMCLDTCRTVRR